MNETLLSPNATVIHACKLHTYINMWIPYNEFGHCDSVPRRKPNNVTVSGWTSENTLQPKLVQVNILRGEPSQ